MPVVRQRSVLSGMQVKEAMRRQVMRLATGTPMAACIARLLKFKSNAVLADDENGRPAGVVSKTDLIGAYYAGLPVDSPIGGIMTGPPLTCYPDDDLESALDLMRTAGVHRLYVTGAEASAVVGTLAYIDIVALLYRYCRACPRRIPLPGAAAPGSDGAPRLAVGDVMTGAVIAFRPEASLAEVIEGLTAARIGAVLIRREDGPPLGVISKTDLILAYLHAAPLQAPAHRIMRSPVATCRRQDFLWEALRTMLIQDVQRLFVHAGADGGIVGVLSLSDAARIRSGTCRACLASRILSGE
jgi:CBS domain-containing protein